MNGMNFLYSVFFEIHFKNINVFDFLSRLLTVCGSSLSHTGGAEGGIVSVKQEHEEVKWYCLLWIDILLTLCVTFNALNFVIYIFPQFTNDTDYKLSLNCGFRNGNMKEECSSDNSNYFNDKGNPVLHLPPVLYCVY